MGRANAIKLPPDALGLVGCNEIVLDQQVRQRALVRVRRLLRLLPAVSDFALRGQAHINDDFAYLRIEVCGKPHIAARSGHVKF